MCEFVDGGGGRCHIAFAAGSGKLVKFKTEQQKKLTNSGQSLHVTLGRKLVGGGLGGWMLVVGLLALLELEVGG